MTMAEFEGYECEFVSGGSIPPNQLTCSLCTHLLRDPCLVDCCGAKYCQACANHLQTNGQPCNVCRVQFNNAEPDANLQRLVLDQEVYCSRKGTDGCEWRGKLLNLAHHECSHQPVEPAHIMAKVNQMMHNMEDRHRRELEMVEGSVRKAYRRELLMIVLVFLSLIMAVGLPLLSQVMTTAHEFTSMTKTMELSLTNLKQEMNSELTTAMKKTEKSLMTLKQEVDSKFAVVMKEADQSLMKMKQEFYCCNPGNYCNKSCQDIRRCFPMATTSGYYQLQSANGLREVYCDMEGTHCGGEGGWMRVAHLNMTDPSSQCPVGFRVETANDKSFCIRDTSSAGCGSMLFEPFGLTYSQVCGYVRGYSYASTDAFYNFGVRSPNEPLSGNYVDGVSITYGTPPTHIWTYAAGYQETGSNENIVKFVNCPCNTPPNTSPPSYVGSSYYCESGTATVSYTWHTSDPLWDGMQCGGDERPCCDHPGLPWFFKDIPTPTTATINMRVCLDQNGDDENIGIEYLEIYIK